MAFWQKGLTSKELAFEMYHAVVSRKTRLANILSNDHELRDHFDADNQESCRRLVVACFFDIYHHFYGRYGLEARTLIPALREEASNWEDFRGYDMGKLLVEFDTELTEGIVECSFYRRWRPQSGGEDCLNSWMYWIIFETTEREPGPDTFGKISWEFFEWANLVLYKKVWRS